MLWVIQLFKVLTHITNFIINVTETLGGKVENQPEQQFQTCDKNTL